MRVKLMPASARVRAVDVVSERELAACPEIGVLAGEAGVRPVLAKGHRALYSHRVNRASSAPLLGRAGTQNPVANLCGAPDHALAGRERAPAKERVRGETEVARDDVAVDPQRASSCGG